MPLSDEMAASGLTASIALDSVEKPVMMMTGRISSASAIAPPSTIPFRS